MSAWHRARETWSTADGRDIEVVVQDRLPDHGLTRLGRRIAARQLLQRDASVDEVADLIGVDPRTVYRWRREDQQTARCGGNPNNHTHREDAA